MTPVTSTALSCLLIMPKAPSSAAEARRITQTVAQEIDKLCISVAQDVVDNAMNTKGLCFVTSTHWIGRGSAGTGLIVGKREWLPLRPSRMSG